ncbi:DNA polymerase I, partial [Candidatus Marinamargulisbacteria bacterium SCGC AG-333-B06]
RIKLNNAILFSMSLLIVDGFSLAFRAYYAYPLSLTLQDGQPINAVFGFMSLLLQSIDQLSLTHVVVCFDRPEPTFRHQAFPDYKANRSPAPDEFKSQVPLLKDAVNSAGIFLLEKAGFEADDLMGKCALLAQASNQEVFIYSSDQDTFQLVSDLIHIVAPKKGQSSLQVYDKEAVFKKMGVYPDQVIDFKALKGDSSDNIPGVKGIGDKTASKLLAEHKTLSILYDHLDDITSKSVREKLRHHRDDAFLSQELATICTNIDLDCDLNDFQCSLAWESLHSLFTTYQFTNLLKKYNHHFNTAIESDTVSLQSNRVFSSHSISSKKELEDVLNRISDTVAFDVETTSLSIHDALIVGISFCFNDTDAYYVPLIHSTKQVVSSDNVPLFNIDATDNSTLKMPSLLNVFQPILENKDIKKIAHNGKYDYQVLKRYGITVQGLEFDTMLAAFLLQPLRGVGLKALAKQYFDVDMIAYKDLVSNDQSFADIPLQEATQYAAADAYYTYQLKHIFANDLVAQQLDTLFYSIECPLQLILAEMEYQGVSVDLTKIHSLSESLTKEQHGIKDSIFNLAKKPFNINSTKQLSEVLFDELNLPVVKKTKTGRSTDNSVLESLLGKHDIIALIMTYRTNEKLLSTYINALPHLIHSRTGKIHTTFHQHIVITGRLSSTSPNLQNIPIRTDKGVAIRSVFVPSQPNHLLMSVDYSQIELRLMAHFSQDQAMIDAFNQGVDIHCATAAIMFDCHVDDVTSDQRYQAKAVNFGIIYGISSFGLSKNINCSVSEAKHMIDNYFLQFPNIQVFIDQTIADARKQDYVRTAFGRIRPLPNINSQHRSQRQFEERASVNTFLQGTAAEILKLAMIRIDSQLNTNTLSAKMIIQVHDELVFDVLDDDKDRLADLVVSEMESVVRYRVPLSVDVSFGKNWKLK